MSIERRLDHSFTDHPDTPAYAPLGVPGRSTVTSRYLLRARDGNGVADDAEHAVERAAGSAGAPLPGELRDRFESSIGADLSDVRVHAGKESAEAAASVGARAYAVGQDIHFAEGAYDPSSSAGQFLIAHEVAHTVQQRGTAPARQYKLAVSGAGDAAEVEADRAAEAMLAGQAAAVGSHLGALARSPDAAPPPDAGAAPASADGAPAKADGELSEEDRGRLANAQQLLDKASGNVGKATAALGAYSAAAPGHLASLKSNFDAGLQIYKTQYERVNQIIDGAKAIYKLQIEILTTIVNQATGQLGGRLTEWTTKANATLGTLENADKALIGAMGSASVLDHLKEFSGEASKATGGVSDYAVGAAKTAATPGDPTASTPGPTGGAPSANETTMELDFYKTYSALQTKAMSLLPLALKVAGVGRPLGEASTFVKVMLEDKKARPDKQPADVEKDAASVWDASAPLAAAAPTVTGMVGELQGLVAQSTASKPKSENEIQKDLWIKWAAGLSGASLDMMDFDKIEKHLKQLGIWDQLGIDIGDYFSDDEEALASCSAAAQMKVLEHKGEAVEVANDYSGRTQVSLAGLPPLSARFESAGTASGARVRAVVVGAQTDQLDPSLLKKLPRSKTAVVDHLIANGFVSVVLRPFETVEPEGDKTEPGAAAP